MQKLIAVRIDDLADGIRVTGIVSRGKNRRVAWRFVTASTQGMLVRDTAIECEVRRAKAFEEQGGSSDSSSR